MVSFLTAMPHRGSKETILSESRDVAKMKKDSMTAIFPLYCKNILQNNKIEEAYEYASKITYETEKGKLARIYEKYLKL